MYVLNEFQCQILAVTPVIFNEFLIGVGFGWIAPTVRLLRNTRTNFPSITNSQASWIASAHSFGNFLGPLISMPLLNLFGRKGVLAIATLSFFVSYALIAFIKSIPAILCARSIFGVALGLHMLTAPLYLCENFKPSLRGVFGAVSIACLYGGAFIEYACANYFSDYALTAYTNATLAFIALLSILASIETPDYLITKGKNEKALDNFLRLRGKRVATADALRDFEKLKQHIEEEREAERSLATFCNTPTYRKSILMVVVFGLLTGATGFDALNSYVSITFTRGVFTPEEYTMVFGGLQFVSAVVGTVVIEMAKRRTILMGSLVVSALVHGSTAGLFYAQTVISVPHFSWLVFGSITTFSMMFSFGILPIYATIMGELLPVNARPIGTGLSTLAYSTACFLITKVFLLVSDLIGVYWNFVFYTLTNTTFLLFVYLVVPETRNKSMVEIQNALRTRIEN